MPEYEFSLTRIFPYKDQRKPVFCKFFIKFSRICNSTVNIEKFFRTRIFRAPVVFYGKSLWKQNLSTFDKKNLQKLEILSQLIASHICYFGKISSSSEQYFKLITKSNQIIYGCRIVSSKADNKKTGFLF